MIENYDDATVEETLEAVSDFSDEEKAEFVAFEQDNKNRTGVVEPLSEELGAVSEDIILGDEDTETDEDDDTSEESEDAAIDEVTVKAFDRGYHGGLWFDNGGEATTVPRTTRVQEAIDNGELEVVD